MATSKLYCLSIKPIYIEHKVSQESLYPMPLYCLTDFNHSLINCINSLFAVLNEHQLTEVTRKITGTSWFFELTNRYHIDITSYIHVTESSVYFSGYLPPYQQKYFRTSAVPLKEIVEKSDEFKSIDLAMLKLPLAKALTLKLETLQSELEQVSDRYLALDEVLTALTNLDQDTIDNLYSATTTCLTELSNEISQLDNQTKSIELEMELLSKKLLYRVLGLTIGDRIFSDTYTGEGKRTQLIINEVDYYSKQLVLTGTKITQKGDIGKRIESIRINLMTGSDDEHQ